MSSRVALVYCSEREREMIVSRLATTDFDASPVDVDRIPEPPDAAFDFVFIGSALKSRHTVIAALRERLHDVPMALFVESAEEAERIEDDDLAVISEADLPRLTYVLRREMRMHETELLLRRGERRYRDLVDNTHEAFWVLDTDSRTTFANRKMAMILGTTVSDLIGSSILEFVDEEWQGVAREALERRRAGIAETYDVHLRRKDGTMIYATITGRPLYDERGKWIGSTALVFDITARKQLVDELVRRDTELSIAHELARLGSWEWDLQTNRIIGSREVFRLLGVGERSGAIDLEEWLSLVHRDDVAALRDAMMRAVAERREFSHQYRLAGKRERIIEASGRVVADADGAPRRMIGMSQDVTQLLSDADRLRRSEQRYRALVDQATDIIYSLDASHCIVSLNPAFEAISGWKREEWIGRPLVDLLDPSSIEALRVQFDLVSRGETSFSEVTLKNANGDSVTLETTARLIAGGDGEATGTVGIARDVTRRKQIELQLEEEKRLSSLGHLAASVAHEFNNVLMSIMPFAELMKRRMPDDERTAIASHHIFQAVKRGRQISQEILRFAQPAKLTLATVDVDAWLRDFVRESAALLGPRYFIKVEKQEEGLYVRADLAALDRVATNLVINARDAMPKGGTLRICARRSANEKGCVAISIRDEGGGIPQHIISRIFDPLFSTKAGGTGLGLSIAHSAMTQQDGALRVESKEGEGSEFTMLLNAVDGASSEMEEELPHDQPRRLLLVEDDDAVGEGIRTLLRDEGFLVRLVTRGEQAVSAVIEFDPDVAILDVNLPDISGLEVLQRLRARWPSLPIVLSTGHVDAEAIDEIRKLRVPALMKPYEISDLVAILGRIESPVRR